MNVLRADQYATVPWKNGGGTTREIAVCSNAGNRDEFLWRLSIATVAQPGPFSRFDGVDRTIALVEGKGMVLRSPTESVKVVPGAPPYSFDGETEISCVLIDGPTVDLNVMSRRGSFRHVLRRVQFVGWTGVIASAAVTMVVSNAVLELSALGRDTLRPLDTVAHVPSGTTLEFYSSEPAEIFVVELTAM